MSDFESQVLEQLSQIQRSLATNAERQNGHEFRLETLEKYNDKQDSRAWIKSLVVGAAVLIGHPLARKLGLDI